MKRVDIKKIIRDPKLRAELTKGGVAFMCALEGHNHKERQRANVLQPKPEKV